MGKIAKRAAPLIAFLAVLVGSVSCSAGSEKGSCKNGKNVGIVAARGELPPLQRPDGTVRQGFLYITVKCADGSEFNVHWEKPSDESQRREWGIYKKNTAYPS